MIVRCLFPLLQMDKQTTSICCSLFLALQTSMGKTHVFSASLPKSTKNNRGPNSDTVFRLAYALKTSSSKKNLPATYGVSENSPAMVQCLFQLSCQVYKSMVSCPAIALHSACFLSYKNHILPDRTTSNLWNFLNAHQSLNMRFLALLTNTQNRSTVLLWPLAAFTKDKALPIHVPSARVKKCYECFPVPEITFESPPWPPRFSGSEMGRQWCIYSARTVVFLASSSHISFARSPKRTAGQWMAALFLFASKTPENYIYVEFCSFKKCVDG